MKPASSVLMRSSNTESAGPTAVPCISFYLFCLSILTGADQNKQAACFCEKTTGDANNLYFFGHYQTTAYDFL